MVFIFNEGLQSFFKLLLVLTVDASIFCSALLPSFFTDQHHLLNDATAIHENNSTSPSTVPNQNITATQRRL